MGNNYKHLTWSDRLIIERLIRGPEYKLAKIAKVISARRQSTSNIYAHAFILNGIGNVLSASGNYAKTNEAYY